MGAIKQILNSLIATAKRLPKMKQQNTSDGKVDGIPPSHLPYVNIDSGQIVVLLASIFSSFGFWLFEKNQSFYEKEISTLEEQNRRMKQFYANKMKHLEEKNRELERLAKPTLQRFVFNSVEAKIKQKVNIYERNKFWSKYLEKNLELDPSDEEAVEEENYINELRNIYSSVNHNKVTTDGKKACLIQELISCEVHHPLENVTDLLQKRHEKDPIRYRIINGREKDLFIKQLFC